MFHSRPQVEDIQQDTLASVFEFWFGSFEHYTPIYRMKPITVPHCEHRPHIHQQKGVLFGKHSYATLYKFLKEKSRQQESMRCTFREEWGCCPLVLPV